MEALPFLLESHSMLPRRPTIYPGTEMALVQVCVCGAVQGGRGGGWLWRGGASRIVSAGGVGRRAGMSSMEFLVGVGSGRYRRPSIARIHGAVQEFHGWRAEE
jgi:hypothetical protein